MNQKTNKSLGENPKWRWHELIVTTKKYFNLEFDIEFTELFYFNYIVPAYTVDRHYHTLRHVEYMLKHVMDFGVSHKDRCLLKWAIWFHDIIYDSKRTDNEERSANMLVDFATALGFEEEDIEVMKWLVLVTTHKGSPQTELEDIICDLDLREFVNDRQPLNAVEVRKEYSFLSDEEWNEGRTAFVKSMLDKEYIYHTDEYRGALEDTARINLQKELDTIT